MATDFFPQRPNAHPMIYAYEDTNPQYKGLLKVGYTAIDVDKRVAQQYPTKRPDGSVPYRMLTITVCFLCNRLRWKHRFLRQMICRKNRFWILQKRSGTWISPKRIRSIHRKLQKDRLRMGSIWKSHAIPRQRQNRQNLHHKSRWICPVLWLAVSFGIKHSAWER